MHMTKESDPRRKVIVATLVGTGIGANVYDAGRRTAMNWTLARSASVLWSMTLCAVPTAC